jgi:nitrite reductase (NADH) small subunit
MRDWVAVARQDDLRRAKRMVVTVDGTQVALFWVGDRVFALDNVCVHRQRELVKGFILAGRIVCPGHQWAFDLESGYEENMCRYQPTYGVRIEAGVVYLDPNGRRAIDPPNYPADARP